MTLHKIRKIWSTVCILTNLGMARTFGEYQISTGGYDQPDFAKYVWRGEVWWIPTSHVCQDEGIVK